MAPLVNQSGLYEVFGVKKPARTPRSMRADFRGQP